MQEEPAAGIHNGEGLEQMHNTAPSYDPSHMLSASQFSAFSHNVGQACHLQHALAPADNECSQWGTSAYQEQSHVSQPGMMGGEVCWMQPDVQLSHSMAAYCQHQHADNDLSSAAFEPAHHKSAVTSQTEKPIYAHDLQPGCHIDYTWHEIQYSNSADQMDHDDRAVANSSETDLLQHQQDAQAQRAPCSADQQPYHDVTVQAPIPAPAHGHPVPFYHPAVVETQQQQPNSMYSKHGKSMHSLES